jgi:hypothetical protein
MWSSPEPTSIVVPEGYRLALTIQGKDWQYPVNANIVRSKDYELTNSNNPGLFFAAHPRETRRCLDGVGLSVATRHRKA